MSCIGARTGPSDLLSHNQLRILDYICKDCISINVQADSKEDVLEKLAKKAAEVDSSLSAVTVYRVLRDREELGSTGIGGGVAIPHGKLPGLERMIIIVAVSPEGVSFDAVDKMPVKVIFLLLAPDDSATLYLKVLARISRFLKIPGAVERLIGARDQEEVRRIIETLDDRL